jgi:hypothetical protein
VGSARLLVIAALACACGRSAIGDGFDLGGDDDGDGDERGDIDDGDADDSDDDREPECDIDSHELDCDGDTIPDADDPFPEDRDRPGRGRNDVIYLQSSTTLSILDMRAGGIVTPIADFTFPDDSYGQVTDIAMDRFGVIYAISSALLHACHPETAECWALGELPTNSLGFVPIGIVDGQDDIMVTLAGSTWIAVRQRGPEIGVFEIGEVDSPYSSSGDIATTAAGLTVFTSPWSAGGDVLVAIDPATAEIIGLVGTPPTIYQVWGVVGYDGGLVLCDQLGGIFGFDPATGESWTIGAAGHECWGAAGHPDLR